MPRGEFRTARGDTVYAFRNLYGDIYIGVRNKNVYADTQLTPDQARRLVAHLNEIIDSLPGRDA